MPTLLKFSALLVSVQETFYNWVKRWESEENAYDPDGTLEARAANGDEENNLVNRFGTLSTAGQSYMLLEHCKVLLSDDITSELQALINTDPKTAPQANRELEIRLLANEEMKRQCKAVTDHFRKVHNIKMTM